MIERDEIETLIPHRRPFLWIDSIVELQPGVRCVARKLVSPEEPYFAGHFPTNPILPGVFLIEAVAQASAVMMHDTAEALVHGTALLGAVVGFKFFKPVRPAQQLVIETRVLLKVGAMARVEGIVTVDGEKVASGELSLSSRA